MPSGATAGSCANAGGFVCGRTYSRTLKVARATIAAVVAVVAVVARTSIAEIERSDMPHLTKKLCSLYHTRRGCCEQRRPGSPEAPKPANEHSQPSVQHSGNTKDGSARRQSPNRISRHRMCHA